MMTERISGRLVYGIAAGLFATLAGSQLVHAQMPQGPSFGQNPVQATMYRPNMVVERNVQQVAPGGSCPNGFCNHGQTWGGGAAAYQSGPVYSGGVMAGNGHCPPNGGFGYGWAPIHKHTYQYKYPNNLRYPQQNGYGMVQYPYYTVRGPSDFFLK